VQRPGDADIGRCRRPCRAALHLYQNDVEEISCFEDVVVGFRCVFSNRQNIEIPRHSPTAQAAQRDEPPTLRHAITQRAKQISVHRSVLAAVFQGLSCVRFAIVAYRIAKNPNLPSAKRVLIRYRKSHRNFFLQGFWCFHEHGRRQRHDTIGFPVPQVNATVSRL
jgi:hypothetical protein